MATLLEQLVIGAHTPPSPTLQPTCWGNSSNEPIVNGNEKEYADTVRNRQIIRTTISSVLILLLKWFKVSRTSLLYCSL